MVFYNLYLSGLNKQVPPQGPGESGECDHVVSLYTFTGYVLK